MFHPTVLHLAVAIHCLFKVAMLFSSSNRFAGSVSVGTSLYGDAGDQVFQGEATTWGANWPSGNCLFEKWPQPQGLGAIAMASNLWDSAGICGACISITGPSGDTHEGIVSDQCPSCKKDSLDLAPDLWKKVSNNQTPGILKISWKIVSCKFSTPIEFINKGGVSKDSTSVQVAGSNMPIESLEILPSGSNSSGIMPGGNWVKLVRQSSSNYFQPDPPSGLGAVGDLRVTCGDGKQIITKHVHLDLPLNTTAATGNC